MQHYRLRGRRLGDPGAQIAAGESCSSTDAHTVSCTKPGDASLLTVEVRLGDGDDSVTAAESRLVAYAGPGADRLLERLRGPPW